MATRANTAFHNLSMDGAFLRRLEVLALASRKLQGSSNIADRAGTTKGGKTDFHGHRGYVEGDDLRDLDWNVYARTDELFLKTFSAERQKNVSLLLDLSPSMDSENGKLAFAMQLAIALGHIALCAGDSFAMAGICGSWVFPRCRTKKHTPRLISELEKAPLAGNSDWERFSSHARTVLSGSGSTVVVSDFWEENPIKHIAPLTNMKQDITLLHILAPQEISPKSEGPFILEDSESGEEVLLTLTKDTLKKYREFTEKHVEFIKEEARRRGMRYIFCNSESGFEATVFRFLRAGGLLK